MTKKIFLLACSLALFAAPSAFAQIDPYTQEHEWGGMHVSRAEVTSFNVSVGDSCSVKGIVTFEFHDKSGRTIFSKSFDVASGQTFTLGVGEADYSARNGVVADAFFVLPADLHLIVPCIKVAFPPGPCTPSGLVTLTAEKNDAVTGRSIVFANNPHATSAPAVTTTAK